MNDLPPEMLLAILEFFDIETLVSFTETSHFWHIFIHENAKLLVQKISCEYEDAPLFFKKKFDGKHSTSPCTFSVDPLGRLQGEVKICDDSFSFKDGQLHGKCKETRYFGQDEWTRETSNYKEGKLHGVLIKEQSDLFDPPKLKQAEIWEEGRLILRDIEFEEKEGITTTFSLCGERVCQEETWDCYKKITKGQGATTTIEYIDGERFVTVNGELLDGPREKGEAWSRCCEKHQREMPCHI
ncbi:F-box containing protein [Tokyovirus A1]|uniref:F-box containing protein n=1 Tax=Tokyovirus A1 TaxID=1826170 RepID=UPI0007A97EFB|nr:F-box containing protein [Tokyovirus A1]BAU79889.1 F-box containing protein [Tokyovirus A1]